MFVPAALIADRYAPREPPNRAETIERSAARTSADVTAAARCWTARANAFENASSGSPVSFTSGLIADQRTAAPPIWHRRPVARTGWPSLSDLMNPFPAACGPLQSLGSRVQRYTQAARHLAGSISPGVVFHSAQPHDQTELKFISRAT